MNYLHLGKALDTWPHANLPSSGVATKRDVISYLQKQSFKTKDLQALVTAYLTRQTKRVYLPGLAQDLNQSVVMRDRYRALGVRGFSYLCASDPEGFPYRLQGRINLRIALFATQDLYYPACVRKYLPRNRGNHYFYEGAPAIAFALGVKTPSAWYVFILQSDLTRRVPSCVRSHFRGWRKVLFHSILCHASRHVNTVYLCNTEDVVRACHKDFHKPTDSTMGAGKIYNGTADHFGLKPVRLRNKIDIQLYDRHAAVYTRKMYKATLTKSSPHAPPGKNHP